MTECGTEMQLLLQADTDGELNPAEAARLATHLAACPSCAEAQAQLIALCGRLRNELPYRKASTALHAAIRRQLTVITPAPPLEAAWRLRRPRWPSRALAIPFGGGFALAACLLLVLMLPPKDDLAERLVASHIRALQPGHLMDVVSNDRHTVKPWFDGRLDFAPPVKDLQPQGFPLAGARLDYIANRPVAALVYQRRQHVINLFIWPTAADRSPPNATDHSGYNVRSWNQDGMTLRAVSDLGAQELSDFVQLWRQAPK